MGGEDEMKAFWKKKAESYFKSQVKFLMAYTASDQYQQIEIEDFNLIYFTIHGKKLTRCISRFPIVCVGEDLLLVVVNLQQQIFTYTYNWKSIGFIVILYTF